MATNTDATAILGPFYPPFPHTTNLQQTTLKPIYNYFSIYESLMIKKDLKIVWQKGKIAHHKQFRLCHNVFKNLSAEEASESVYMRGKD